MFANELAQVIRRQMCDLVVVIARSDRRLVSRPLDNLDAVRALLIKLSQFVCLHALPSLKPSLSLLHRQL